ncbi:hypothetical protein MMC10_009572 [Thelotrema lepadinum]|nr:hypothetical protein [Thelotrema lepadinum]
MRASKSLVIGMTLLLGSAWAGTQGGTGGPPQPSIHNCPGYRLNRRAHGGVCPPPPGQGNNNAKPMQPGGPVSNGPLSSGSPGGALYGSSGSQGKQATQPSANPMAAQIKPNKRSVSDLFFDDDTGAFFLRRAESQIEPLLFQRTPSEQDTALLRRQAALDVYIRQALEAAKLDNSMSSRSVPAADDELFDFQSRDAQPIQEAEHDGSLWSRAAILAEQDLDLYIRNLDYHEPDLQVRSAEVAGDIGLYSREAMDDEQLLWDRNPGFYEGEPIPV